MVSLSTHLEDPIEEPIEEPQKNDNEPQDIRKDGWVWKKSKHLNKYRKRWMLLKGFKLYCYQTNNILVDKPTETFNLKMNEYIAKRHHKISNIFYLYNKTSAIKRTFQVITEYDANDWISEINEIIQLFIKKNAKLLFTPSINKNNNKYIDRYVCSESDDDDNDDDKDDGIPKLKLNIRQNPTQKRNADNTIIKNQNQPVNNLQNDNKEEEEQDIDNDNLLGFTPDGNDINYIKTVNASLVEYQEIINKNNQNNVEIMENKINSLNQQWHRSQKKYYSLLNKQNKLHQKNQNLKHIQIKNVMLSVQHNDINKKFNDQLIKNVQLDNQLNDIKDKYTKNTITQTQLQLQIKQKEKDLNTTKKLQTEQKNEILELKNKLNLVSTDHLKLKNKLKIIDNSLIWYWENDKKLYEKYNDNLSKEIQSFKIGVLSKLKIGNFMYNIMKESIWLGYQMNIKTKKKRKIKYLRENEQKEYNENFIINNAAATSTNTYYKPFNITIDKIKTNFFTTVNSAQYEIISVVWTNNSLHQKMYESILETKCLKYHKNSNEIEALGWHGTTFNAMECIIKNGFDRSRSKTAYFGKGSYFAINAKYSLTYTKIDKISKCYHMMFCRFIIGKSVKGKSDMKIIPNDKNNNNLEYDSMVNILNKPTIISIWRDFHAVPIAVVKYKKNKKKK